MEINLRKKPNGSSPFLNTPMVHCFNFPPYVHVNLFIFIFFSNISTFERRPILLVKIGKGLQVFKIIGLYRILLDTVTAKKNRNKQL